MTTKPYTMAAIMAAVGAVGMLGLAPRIEWLHVASTFLAFAAGWSWPVFTNFGIMRANGGAAGAASGVTRRWASTGCLPGRVTGWTVDEYGYGAMWTLVAVCVRSSALPSLRHPRRVLTLSLFGGVLPWCPGGPGGPAFRKGAGQLGAGAGA